MATDLGPPGPVAREWPGVVDVGDLVAAGWRPTPFREFVLKIHSRCDLACDYCYVYEMADQSWRSRPRRMSPATIARTAERIAEHVRAHDLPSIRLTLHGGEPLLAGPDVITELVSAVRDRVGSTAEIDTCVQTNAVRLDLDYLHLFRELGIKVGVSLDGNAAAHDRHRRFANGQGSHDAVTAALRRLAGDPFRHLFSGLLCTVDIRNDPIATYESLLTFDPPAIDFLLPHGNWTSPPPARIPDSADTPYADWLIAIFDLWYGSPRQRTRIRLFAEIMNLLLGGDSATESVGLSPFGAVVVETDGHIEQTDTLKSAYDGAARTPLHVERDSFDAALMLPSIAVRQIGVQGLAERCQRCPVRRVCGGGLYAHRYRAGHGFAQPSVYCPDLLRLISHIQRSMQTDIDALGKGRG